MLPELKKKPFILPDFYNQQIVPMDSVSMASQQMPIERTTLPPVERNQVRLMNDTALTQNAVQGARDVGILPTQGQSPEERLQQTQNWTPEKRAHWAMKENEFAAEKLRRQEEKTQQKKNANITHGIGEYVKMGKWTPEEAVLAAKERGIETSPDFFVNYLPTIKNPNKPLLPTIDEYKAKKMAEQQMQNKTDMELAQIEVARAKANELNAGAYKDTLPPVVSDLDKAKTLEIQKNTEQMQPEKPAVIHTPMVYKNDKGEDRVGLLDETGAVIKDLRPANDVDLGIKKSPPKQITYYDGKGNKLIQQTTVDDFQNDLSTIISSGGSLTAPKGLKQLPAGEVAKLAPFSDLITAAKLSKDLFDKEFVGKWDSGVQGRFKEATGIGLSDKEAEFRRTVQSLIRRVYAESGKQISVKEMQMLEPIIPRLNQSDKYFSTNLDNFITEMETMLSQRKQALSDAGYDVNAEPNTSNNDPLGLGL